MKELTQNQTWVLESLRQRGLHWIAGATEREWSNGKSYYIDTRVNAKGIRRRFAQGNKEATQ